VIEVGAALVVWLGARSSSSPTRGVGSPVGLAVVTIGFVVLAWGRGQPIGDSSELWAA